MRILCLLCALLSIAVASESPRTAPQAVLAGLAWLRARQQDDGGVAQRQRVAATSLAVLAHLAAGVTADQPGSGPAMRRMLSFVCARADANGWLGVDNGRMTAHAIACLALAEAIGTTRDDDLDERMRDVLTRALAVTIAAGRVTKQAPYQGGWRHFPGEVGSDTAVTGWVMQSLLAARRLGLAVPDDVYVSGLTYLRGCLGDDGRMGYAGRSEDTAALRGLALLTLDLGDDPRPGLRERVLARMHAEPPTWTGPWFFYRCYYDAIGLSQTAPVAWPEYREALYRVLLANQAQDGSWPAPPGDNERELSAAYATALATLALCADLRLLPGLR